MKFTGDIFAFFLAQPQIVQFVFVAAIIWAGRRIVIYRWPQKAANGNGTKVIAEKMESLETQVTNHLETSINRNTETLEKVNATLVEVAKQNERVVRYGELMVTKMEALEDKFGELRLEVVRGNH